MGGFRGEIREIGLWRGLPIFTFKANYCRFSTSSYVDDATTGSVRTHSYTYNANGSLDTVTYANGLRHAYGYDTLNRLRTLSVSNLQSQILNSYTYNLRASGHRRQIVEASGRTATHAYDDLYRLTGETITADPTGRNGSVSYDLDAVGNRLSRTSQISNLTSQIGRTYNARDWLDGDTYDANGNTTNGLLSLGTASTDVYDFENRLILRIKGDGSQINLSYDADGNRLQKSLFDAQFSLLATHYYLVDTNNHTGYAQVVEERTTTSSGTTLKTYTYGADLISVAKSDLGLPTTDLRYYLYDGLGSVRALTDATGVVTDSYTYDAFGNLLAKTGTTDNAYLYRGEQWDADLGLYYNRARFLNPDSGRFWNMDTYEGSSSDPLSLHKYLYANANPVRYSDPSGHLSRIDYMFIGTHVHTYIGLDFKTGSPTRYANFVPIQTILNDFSIDDAEELLRPDLVDTATREVYEIKPDRTGRGLTNAQKQLKRYIDIFNDYVEGFRPGTSYNPPTVVPPPPLYWRMKIRAWREAPGVILYEIEDDGEKQQMQDVAVTVASYALVRLFQMASAASLAQNEAIQGRLAISAALGGRY